MRRSLTLSLLMLAIILVLASCAAPGQGPTAWLDRPLDGSHLPLAPVTILAHASDVDGVASFEFFVDEESLATVPADGGRLAHATAGWNPTEPGTYTVGARATDSAGNIGSEATAVVTVGELPQASPTLPLAPEETPAGPGPEVEISFTADRTDLTSGECATLMWTVQGGEAVLLQGEPVPASGDREVCPEQTTSYTLAAYVGLGPPSPPVAERELVIVVGEPSAATPLPTSAAPTATGIPPTATAMRATATPTTPSPSPTSTSGCAGAPVISFFRANPSTITAGQSTTLEWGAVTNGNSDVLVRSVVINPGLGEVGSPGSRVVSPGSTTTYTLVATGCGGTAQKQVTVTVNPVVFSADLAITDLYAQSLYGPLWFRVTNRGPGTVNNVTVQVSCQWDRSISGRHVDSGQSGSIPIPIANLSPGQTQAFNTDVSLQLPSYDYVMTCTIQVPFSDPNLGNNTHSETLTQQNPGGA
jgi:hypothetical protein